MSSNVRYQRVYDKTPAKISFLNSLPFGLGEDKVKEYIDESEINSPCRVSLKVTGNYYIDGTTVFNETFSKVFDNPAEALDNLTVELYRIYRKLDKRNIEDFRTNVLNQKETSRGDVLDSIIRSSNFYNFQEIFNYELTVDEVYSATDMGFSAYGEIHNLDHFYRLSLAFREMFMKTLSYAAKEKMNSSSFYFDMRKEIAGKIVSADKKDFPYYAAFDEGCKSLRFTDVIDSFSRGLAFKSKKKKSSKKLGKATVQGNFTGDNESLNKVNPKSAADPNSTQTSSTKARADREQHFDELLNSLMNDSSTKLSKVFEDDNSFDNDTSLIGNLDPQVKLKKARKSSVKSWESPMFNNPVKRKREVEEEKIKEAVELQTVSIFDNHTPGVGLKSFARFKSSTYVGEDLRKMYCDFKPLWMATIG